MDSTPVTEETRQLGARRVRYLERTGDGPAVLLVHGWPQHADSWRPVLSSLLPGRRLLAPDLPGIGGSTAGDRGSTKTGLAAELEEFVQAVGADRVAVAGHDVGGMVAYAFARTFPGRTVAAAVLDVPVPGLDPWDDVLTGPESWHFAFHRQDPLAEDLVDGRQAAYFRYFADSFAHDPAAVTDEAIAAAARAYARRDQLTAGFGFYRAFATDAAENRSRTGPLDVPILVAGGAHSMGEAVTVLATALRRTGVTEVHENVIADSGHWLAEEQPARTVTVLNEFLADRT